MNTKLNAGQRHILNLIARDAEEDEWTPVSKVLYPHLVNGLPPELVEIEPVGEAGRARLTEEGKNVMVAMAWL